MDRWLVSAKKSKLSSENCETISNDDAEINKEKSNFLSNEPNEKNFLDRRWNGRKN